MNIERLESRLEKIICDSIHWQDLFQIKTGILNEPMSPDEHTQIKQVGRLRFRHDVLFNQRVKIITINIIDEIQKTIKTEDNHQKLKCSACGREYNSEDWPNTWRCSRCN